MKATDETISNEYCGKACRLYKSHLDLIKASSISPEVSSARGYRSEHTRSHVKRLGFGDSQCLVPALLLPLWNAHGKPSGYQLRPDSPRVLDGKVVKYETPARMRMIIDVHPFLSRPRTSANPNAHLPGEPLEFKLPALIGDSSIPVLVTEGTRKADAAVSIGLCCIALLGVWNWRGTNSAGGKVALTDWENIAINNGRPVYICFDSDVMNKHQVHAALVRFRAFVESHGARVGMIYLPAGEHGSKVGLDDFIAARVQAGGSEDQIQAELFALATDELRQPPNWDSEENGIITVGPYRAKSGGIYWLREVHNALVEVRLTNFTASIAATICRDDGAESVQEFEIEATINGQAQKVNIPSAQFISMNWVTDKLGAGAIIAAGFGSKDRAREAIQQFSTNISSRTVFTHTGWREVANDWVYLHAGGAIGADGPVEDIAVEVPEALARMILPTRASAQSLRDAVAASLHLLDLAPEQITIPAYSAIWRVVLDRCDFSVHLAGPTGTFKTEFAALLQQHFGQGFDSRNLPAAWSSTPNFLEIMAFVGKDMLLTIDDFAPTGTAVDRARLQATADRVLRGQGNSAGRGRLRTDLSSRPPRPPRGVILSTGEDIPGGQSLRARVAIIEISPGDIDAAQLTICQAEARLYAGATAGFLQWCAARLDSLRENIKQRFQQLRSLAATSRSHRRTPSLVADLFLGFEVFIEFAHDVGALTDSAVIAYRERAWRALGTWAVVQVKFQHQSEPTSRFLELLSSAISAGRAHVASKAGTTPEDASAWGWRSQEFGSGENFRIEWREQGDCVGWLDDDALYLEPDASFKAAQGMAADGNSISISRHTLGKRLKERNLLASTDQARETLTVRRTLQGHKHEVWHLLATILIESKKPDILDKQARDDGRQASLAANVGFRNGQMSRSALSFEAHGPPERQINSKGIPPNVGNVRSFAAHRGVENQHDALDTTRHHLMSAANTNPTSKPDKALEEMEIDRLAALDANQLDDDDDGG
jgi:hypothetical protein